VENFFDEPCCEEFCQLGADGLFLFCRESSEALLLRFCRPINIQFVLSQFPWDSRLVCGFPGENVSVVPEETGERGFLFGIHVGTNHRRLGWITSAEVARLELHFLGAAS
jgi:hypothetical protein